MTFISKLPTNANRQKNADSGADAAARHAAAEFFGAICGSRRSPVGAGVRAGTGIRCLAWSIGEGLLAYRVQHIDDLGKTEQHDTAQKTGKERSQAKGPADLVFHVERPAEEENGQYNGDRLSGWYFWRSAMESKIAATERLRREGRWDEASQYRDQRARGRPDYRGERDASVASGGQTGGLVPEIRRAAETPCPPERAVRAIAESPHRERPRRRQQRLRRTDDDLTVRVHHDADERRHEPRVRRRRVQAIVPSESIRTRAPAPRKPLAAR